MRFLTALIFALTVSTTAAQTPGGKIRNYYVAVDEVEWDYAPKNIDEMTGQAFDRFAKIWIERGSKRIGKVYRKALYREYTDATFKTLKPREGDQRYLGILGPILRGEVGDTIKIVFRNNATQTYSMHPHGVFYKKASEGALYNDGVPLAEKPGAAVPPGGSHTYEWVVTERSGPGPGDGSSVVWLYHSHVHEPKDVNSGLVGALIVNARGASRPDGTPKDVDREFVTLFMVFDENQTWYLDHNIRTYADPKSVEKGEFIPVDVDGASSLFIGGGFATVNHKFTINGYLFGNGPMMTMKQGERVRWYLLSLGDGFNFHTPHWHGNVVLRDKRRTDVVTLMPAEMAVADMTADNPGIWMFHCHVSDHLEAGMHAHYHVLPATPAARTTGAAR